MKYMKYEEVRDKVEKGDTIRYTDIESKDDAARLIEEYLIEVVRRHPAEDSEQCQKGVWFAIGYLGG